MVKLLLTLSLGVATACAPAPSPDSATEDPIRGGKKKQRCGDGVCSRWEDCGSCAADCGACAPTCGDGTCDAAEDCASCEADCGACAPTCGDGTCDAAEDCASCEADCGACAPTCGDGTCDASEDCTSCEADCGACAPSSVTLAWDPSDSPDTVGYEIHYSLALRDLGQTLDVGHQTRFTMSDLERGQTYYFGVVAYDAAGNKSTTSNVVSIVAP